MLIILIIIKMTSQLFTALSFPGWRALTNVYTPGFIQKLRAGVGGGKNFLINLERNSFSLMHLNTMFGFDGSDKKGEL